MNRSRAVQPTPGHPVPRGGKVYIWVTWLAKLLGGDQCVWKIWFMARYKHAKLPEHNAEQLAEWNRDHAQLMREKKRLLEENGWRVQTEVAFALTGQTAIVAGKEDLVATLGTSTLVVDGKTGKRRDSDIWQVLIYLYERVHRPVPVGVDRPRLSGEVHYRDGDLIVRLADLKAHEHEIVDVIKSIASDVEPSRNPGKFECERCTIRPEDCPDRYNEAAAAARALTTGAF